MSQTMMLPFSAGALLLLLPLLGDLALGEISKDFHQCLQFFYKRLPPKGIAASQYQPICQYYNNEYRFATMYHRGHRAPVYSAYKLKVRTGPPERNDWKYEPQLVDVNASREMKIFQGTIDENLRDSQAIPEDYSDSGYTKGHLAPVCHQETLQDREATYTLTNIVPQKEGSNNGPWSALETKVLNKFRQHCTGDMYVITGVIPYKKKCLLKKRVSIPEYIWSAYCCPKYTSTLKAHFEPTYAAVGRNDPNSGNDIVERGRNSEGYDVKEMSLEALEKILRKRLFMGIELFNEECRPN